MEMVWMLVTLIGGQVIESDLQYAAAKDCYAEAARLQVEAHKAIDLAFILAHEHNYTAEPARPIFSCVPRADMG